MSCTNEDFTITQGDNRSYAITAKNKQGVSLIDAGFTVWMTVKNSVKDSYEDAVIKNKNVATAPMEVIGIGITHDDTKDLPLKSYYYDVRIKASDDVTWRTIQKGRMTVTYQVSDENA